MKIIFRTAALAALVIATSCGKDDPKSDAEQSEELAEQLESTALEANIVSDNVIIVGGTKEEGLPPSANGMISLDLSNTSKIAFLDEGFDVTLASDGNVTGAYLRFKGEDGTVASSYYDINMAVNSADDKSGKRINSKFKNSRPLTAKTDETDLDIDFNTTIEPGKFCYEICVYDAAGNISEPQDICITVEAWGGNSAAVGKWKLDKWFYDYDAERIYLENEENCITNTDGMYCSGIFLESVERDDCTLTEYWDIELKADGTYIEREKIIWKTTYADISKNPCLEEEVSEDIYTFDSTGKWSYIDAEDKFIFITYSDEEIYNGESNSYTAEPGEGGIYYGAGGYDGEVSVSDGRLIVKSFEETTAHFKK